MDLLVIILFNGVFQRADVNLGVLLEIDLDNLGFKFVKWKARLEPKKVLSLGQVFDLEKVGEWKREH